MPKFQIFQDGRAAGANPVSGSDFVTLDTLSPYIKSNQTGSWADASSWVGSNSASLIASGALAKTAIQPSQTASLAASASVARTAMNWITDKSGSIIASASYSSTDKKIYFYDSEGIASCFIDATDFIKDGMLASCSVDSGDLVLTFNTDAGQEPIRLALTEIFDPANYYDKDDVDELLENLDLGDHNVIEAIEFNGTASAINNKTASITVEIPDAPNQEAEAWVTNNSESVADAVDAANWVEANALNLEDSASIWATGDGNGSAILSKHTSFFSKAGGAYAVEIGLNNDAAGAYSFAGGIMTTASGYAAHAEGYKTVAQGSASHAEGSSSIAAGKAAHAEGYFTSASGDSSHAEGSGTKAIGNRSHTEGMQTTASAVAAHAEGWLAVASGRVSHAEGSGSKAEASSSHAEGEATRTTGKASHAEGSASVAYGTGSHAEGFKTVASASYAHAEGYDTKAKNSYSHAEGYQTTASGSYSHAEGQNTLAQGGQSHAEGSGTKAIGNRSHTEGSNTTALTESAHAEGYLTTASGWSSHAEGSGSKATGAGSHAEGWETTAEGQYSHTLGFRTYAGGLRSFAGGEETTASGDNSFAFGQSVKATGKNEVALGKHNLNHYGQIFSIGAGEITTQATQSKNAVSIITGSGVIPSASVYIYGVGGYDGTNPTAGTNDLATVIANAGGDENVIEAIEVNGTASVVTNKTASITIAIPTSSGGGGDSYWEAGVAPGSLVRSNMTGSALSPGAISLGMNCRAESYAAVAEGLRTSGSGYAAHAEGYQTKAAGMYAHAEGYGTVAGDSAHAEGYWTSASAYGHAEGFQTSASAYAHAEGSNTKALGQTSHAEGNGCIASGNYSHVEGEGCQATGSAAHAEGSRCVASGSYSHAEGQNCRAGLMAHAGGQSATASAALSFAHGSDVIASNPYEVAFGRYNISEENQLFSIGYGYYQYGVVRRNAVSIVTASATGEVLVYVAGIGGYDGTNPTSGSNDLATVIANAGSGGGTPGAEVDPVYVAESASLKSAATWVESNSASLVASASIAQAASSSAAAISAKTGSYDALVGLPAVTSADNGKILRVVNGAWALVDPVTIYSGQNTPDSSMGNDGDIYLQS